MRVLLIGKNGQVGWELERALATIGELATLDYPEIDLADAGSIRKWVHQVNPHVIVNAAAYTDVDGAEGEPELATAINGTAPGVLAEEAQVVGAVLVHYSTDYVFDGETETPYTEEDPPNPINAYGRSKLTGEQAVQQVDGAYLILRTSWVYSLRRECFLTRVLKWAREFETLKIVTDQVGSPTWCRMLAEVTAQMLAMGSRDLSGWLDDRKGIYHLAGKGHPNRLEWALAILDFDPHQSEQVCTKLLPAISTDFPTPAKRPHNSALNCAHFEKTFGLNIPFWKDSLQLAMGEA